MDLRAICGDGCSPIDRGMCSDKYFFAISGPPQNFVAVFLTAILINGNEKE